MKKIGFIGCGKMAGAIISAIKDDYNVIGSEINEEFAKSASQRLGIEVYCDNKKLAVESDVVFIAVKPNQAVEVLEGIKNFITPEKLVVSICAGVTTVKIENILSSPSPAVSFEPERAEFQLEQNAKVRNSGEGIKVIRIMPNTPALVKLGMFGICAGSKATDDDVKFIENLLSSIGKCIDVTEKQMDIVTAISGSGPAFFYQVIEDMARAGEKLGLEYEKSLTLATQTALGSAQMVFNRGETPVQTLIDNVATKGGCTFVGIQEMKKYDSTKVFYDVIDKTTQKACELGK